MTERVIDVLVLIEWGGLIWSLVGLAVVFTSHFAIVDGKTHVFGLEPINVKNHWIVMSWLLPGFLFMVGARLLRIYYLPLK